MNLRHVELREANAFVEQQQIAHLIAVVNRSIHPYEPSF